MRLINPRRVKIHWTHKWRIKRLFVEGYTIDELSIAYKLPEWYLTGLTTGLKRNERV